MIWECHLAKDMSTTTLSRWIFQVLVFLRPIFYTFWREQYELLTVILCRLWVRQWRWMCTTTTTRWASQRTTSTWWSMPPSSSKSALELTNMWASQYKSWPMLQFYTKQKNFLSMWRLTTVYLISNRDTDWLKGHNNKKKGACLFLDCLYMNLFE